MTYIGIIGIGFVGLAISKSLIQKGFIVNETLFLYDKYKIDYSLNFDKLFVTDILFLTLPTLYNLDERTYDMTPIEETLDKLREYKGLIVIKSTVEPSTCNRLYCKYNLNIVHNPEFLTARTALDDFNGQKHIIIGLVDNVSCDILETFYKTYYCDAEVSKCSSVESESIKLFLNSFYAIKVQVFTEIYLLCSKLNIDYERVVTLMLKNGWINPMHTQVPGPDGQLSYGGMCFPKDTNALCNFMERCGVCNGVLKATIDERDEMRKN